MTLLKIDKIENCLSDKINPYYRVTGNINEEGFGFVARPSNDIVLVDTMFDEYRPFIDTDDGLGQAYDFRTEEYLTGQKHYKLNSDHIQKDIKIAHMREVLKDAVLTSAQRELNKIHQLRYINKLNQHCFGVDKPIINHQTALDVLPSIITSDNRFKKELHLPEIDLTIYSHAHISKFMGFICFLAYSPKHQFFDIQLCEPVYQRLHFYYMAAKYVRDFNITPNHCNLTQANFIKADTGIEDTLILIKDHHKKRFVNVSDVKLTRFLYGDPQITGSSDDVYAFESFEQAWEFAYKYVIDPELVLGFSLNEEELSK